MVKIVPFYLWVIMSVISFLYYNRLFMNAYNRLKLRDDRFDSASGFLKRFLKPSFIQDDYRYDRELAESYLKTECRRGLAPFLATIITLLSFPGGLFQVNILGPNILVSVFAVLSLICVAISWWLPIYYALCQSSQIKLANPRLICLCLQVIFIIGYITAIERYFINA
jgi:hypothetical protein